MQGVWVPSLVGELRSHRLPGVAKKKKKEGAAENWGVQRPRCGSQPYFDWHVPADITIGRTGLQGSEQASLILLTSVIRYGGEASCLWAKPARGQIQGLPIMSCVTLGESPSLKWLPHLWNEDSEGPRQGRGWNKPVEAQCP